jgi:hypothetical protein
MPWYDFLTQPVSDLWNDGNRAYEGSGAQHAWHDAVGPRHETPTTAGAPTGPLAMLPRDENGNPIPVTRETLPAFIRQRWLDSMNAGISPEVDAAAAGSGATPSTYRGGSTAAGPMTDFYGVPVTLPEGMTPEMMLAQMRDGMNEGVRPGDGRATDFDDIVNFPNAGPGGRRVGEMTDLNLAGPDNGTIIYNDVDISDGDFSVNTATTDSAGLHPVSGRRSWGYVPYGDGQFMFYTSGSDTHVLPGSDVVGQGAQLETWMAMSRALQERVREAGGTADDIIFDRERQDTALMGRDPGTLTLDDIRQDGAMESDSAGMRLIEQMRASVEGSETGIDDALFSGGIIAADGAGAASRYAGMGADYLAENYGDDVEGGLRGLGGLASEYLPGGGALDMGANWLADHVPHDAGNPDDWAFTAGDVAETGMDVANWAGDRYEDASRAWDDLWDW